MSLPEFDNLARIGQLKAEPRNPQEVIRMLAMAQTRLRDAKLNSLSLEGRFTSAYNAAHAAALAALRWHGYLTHTLGWPANRWRVLDTAHQKRNLAEYEGYLDVEESTVAEMCELVQSLIADLQLLLEK